MINAIILNQKDNVATLIGEATKGQSVCLLDMTKNNIGEIVALEQINFGHKIALSDIIKNQPIIKYGEIIAVAIKDIKKGENVHIHNAESQRGRGDRTLK